MTTAIEPLAVSIKEAARILGVSRGHIYDLLNGLEVESRWTGSRRLVDYKSLRDYYDRLRRAS